MIQNRWFRCSVGSAISFLMVAVHAGAPATASEISSCAFQFDAVAESAHGTLSSGDKLHGRVKFTLGGIDESVDARDYRANGEIRVSRPGHGEISGAIRFVRVTRSPHVADSVLIDARDVRGNLGKVELNFDPMLFTLYGKRGMLSNFDLPKATEGWNAFNEKRVFQYHSPVSQNTVLYQIGPLSGGCT